METRLECAVSDQLALRVDFIKLADRYGHELSAVIREGSAENVVPLCASVEGAGDDPWPPSPPLQSLSIEKPGGRSTAFLLGMAGTSHWSASIEFADEPRPYCCLPIFDIACRASSPPRLLRSTYRIADGVVVCEGKGGVGLQHVGARIVAGLSSCVGPSMVRTEWNSSRAEFQFCAEPNSVDPPVTIQWRYNLFAKRLS